MCCLGVAEKLSAPIIWTVFLLIPVTFTGSSTRTLALANLYVFRTNFLHQATISSGDFCSEAWNQ